MIDYVIGDATQPAGEAPRIIVHVCDDVGGWGKGFVTALSKRWKAPEREYRAWYRGQAEGAPPFELGRVQLVQVEETLWVANLVGQKGLRWSGGKPPVRYEAIRAGLVALCQLAKTRGASVHMPRIGCGLAGGKWEELEPIIEDELADRGVAVTVYDLD